MALLHLTTSTGDSHVQSENSHHLEWVHSFKYGRMSEFHVVFIIITILFVLYSDEQGLTWLLGRKSTLSKKVVDVLHIVVSAGLGGIVFTGGLMFLDRAEYLISQPVFIIKMIFVLALMINAFFIGSLSRIAAKKPYASLTPSERYRVLASGAVSVLGWVGAVICGLVLAG